MSHVGAMGGGSGGHGGNHMIAGMGEDIGGIPSSSSMTNHPVSHLHSGGSDFRR